MTGSALAGVITCGCRVASKLFFTGLPPPEALRSSSLLYMIASLSVVFASLLCLALLVRLDVGCCIHPGYSIVGSVLLFCFLTGLARRDGGSHFYPGYSIVGSLISFLPSIVGSQAPNREETPRKGDFRSRSR